MVMKAALAKTYTVEEYLALEEFAPVKHDFLNGKLHTLPGGTVKHNKIALRIASEILNITDDNATEYHVFNSDMKIRIEKYNHFVYPDAVVICENIEYYEGRKDIIVNPILIVEVLSASTEEYDRGGKFMKYKTLPSFKEYVLVRQDAVEVTTFYQKEKGVWLDTVKEDLSDKIELKSIGCALDLARIYKGISFDKNK